MFAGQPGGLRDSSRWSQTTGRVIKIISTLLRAIEEFDHGNLKVAQAGSSNLIVTYPDEILYEAIEKMIRNDVGRLPVVSREKPREILGYLGRAAVMTARLHRMKEDQEREPGWLQGLA